MTAPASSPDVAVLHRASAIAGTWHDEAKRRRSRSTVDPVADTLETCARELLGALTNAELEEVSTAEYARAIGKSVQTVRRWCALGQIIARRDGHDYRIRRGEAPPKFRRAS